MEKQDTTVTHEPPRGPYAGSAGHSGRQRALRVVLHVLATLACALVLVVPMVDASTLALLHEAMDDHQFEPPWALLAAHMGCAAALWFAMWKAWRLWHERHRQPVRVVRLNRGTVVTETLIVLVPFLLLASGLAQLTVNNMANVMAHLAAYQGARAAWLWVPEISGGTARGGVWPVTSSEVAARARLAAAAVLAPTVPANYVAQNTNVPVVVNLRGVMTANFLPGMISGKTAQDAATALLGSNVMNQANFNQLNFQGGVDTKSLAGRAAVKLTFAFHALEEGFQVIGISGGDEVGVRLTYQMSQTFPWFAYIGTGQRKMVGGRNGYYLPMTREYTLRAQIGN